MNTFLSDIRHDFSKHKRLADKAMTPLDEAAFFRRPGDAVNSIAIIVKHVGGNLLSRWTDFLATDGEKPNRNRDGEFVIGPDDTRAALMAHWEAGWGALFGTIDSLQPADLAKTIAVRGEPQTAQQALLRGLAHAAYHAGQITYLCRLWNPSGQWLTIAPGQSASHQGAYRAEPSR